MHWWVNQLDKAAVNSAARPQVCRGRGKYLINSKGR